MKHIGLLFLAFVVLLSCNAGEKTTKVRITTDYGVMVAELFNTTPEHRDNFIKLAEEGFYDSLLFHRVISQFMIQGGDPNSKNATPTTRLGSGGPGYRIPAEIGEFHFKGRLAAARTGDAANPQRESSGSQFYIVQGRTALRDQLSSYEEANGFKYSEEDIKLYETVGGTPFLDGQYTVFGQVTEGLEVIDKIAAVQTAPGDRPVEDVRMKVEVIN